MRLPTDRGRDLICRAQPGECLNARTRTPPLKSGGAGGPHSRHSSHRTLRTGKRNRPARIWDGFNDPEVNRLLEWTAVVYRPSAVEMPLVML